ncbi:MAG: outer membrane beta-barrel protein [Lutibacter sp.]
MKKQILLLITLVISASASAQFYVSASGGYSIGSAGILTGTSLNDDWSKASNHYGSYGEGLNTQIKAGYFFNDMFGVELGLGYLHGEDQDISSYKTNDAKAISEYTEGTAHARAYGLTAALVYNFNQHIYGRIGAVTKVGGKTEAEFTRTNPTPFGSPVMTVGKTDYHGRIPLGFTAAIGYKYKLTENLNLFAELEYLGINVTRDYSEFTALTITTPPVPANALYAGSPAMPSSTWNLGDAPLVHPVFGTLYAPTEITYEDDLSTSNTDPSKALSSVAPYSSFGLNIGITYTFSKKVAKSK